MRRKRKREQHYCDVRVYRKTATMHREYIQRFADLLEQLPDPWAKVGLTVAPLSYRQRALQRATVDVARMDGLRKYEVTIWAQVYRTCTTEQLFNLVIDAVYADRATSPTPLADCMRELYDSQQPQLGIVWAFPPAPPKKRGPKVILTARQKREATARKMLALWQRRHRRAAKKVAEYTRKVRYYEAPLELETNP